MNAICGETETCIPAGVSNTASASAGMKDISNTRGLHQYIMKHISIVLALSALGLNASSAIMPQIPAENPAFSAEKPETSLAATQAQFIYHPGFYEGGDGYQLLITNCEEGFNSEGTMPAGPGQLFSVVLCAPKAADENAPVLPAGKYVFAESPAQSTFGKQKGYFLDAFDQNGTLANHQMFLKGGTVEITEENGIYTVEASVSAYTGSGDEEKTYDCTASYTGPVMLPANPPAIPGSVYELNVPEMQGAYDPASNMASFSFSEFKTDTETMLSEGDFLVIMLIYQNGEGDLNALPGTYTCARNSSEWVHGRFAGGQYYDLGMGFTVPLGSYAAIYDEIGAQKFCSLAVGGTVTVSAVGAPSDGNMKFDFDLIAGNGTKLTGSWEGNVAEKVTVVAGVDEISIDEVVKGMEGRIEAPEGAEVYTLSGIRTGKENLRPGLYIVHFKGNTAKVVVK